MKNLRYRVRSTRRRGLSIVETALAIPIFVLVLFGIVDVGRVLFAHMTLQHAVREAGRFAVTGRISPGTGGSHPRLDSIIQVVVDDSAPFPLTSSDVQVSSAGGGSGSAGGPGDRVTIAVSYPVRLLTPLIGVFFPNGAFVVDVATTFRNEPFPGAGH
jgi:Flp pilus assembly protein TadG